MARLLLFFALLGFGWPVCAQNLLPRPRAPRLLRLVDDKGAPLGGDCFAPQFASNGNGLYFLRSQKGAQSLWFASPLVQPGERFPAWRARLLWQPKAPIQLSEARVLDGDTSFVATGVSGSTMQLWRVEVGREAKVQTLWSGRERMAHPAPSPDGKAVVFTRFVRDWKGSEAPQLWQIAASGRDAKPTLVVKGARRALWLDGATLVFERIAGSSTAFYSINPFAPESPKLLLRGSGEGAAFGNGAGLVFAARPAKASTTSLFSLARDGSGLRALTSIPGARRPAVALDDSRLAFDAPAPKTRALSLWIAALDADSAQQSPLSSASFHRAPSRFRRAPCEIEPMPLPPPAPPGNPSPRPTLLPTPLPVPTPSPEPNPTPTPTPPSPHEDRADMDVAGTLADVAANGKMRVVFWAKNRGTRSWTPEDVRVVVRWVDFVSGTRRRWSFNWMRGGVAPMAQARFPLDVIAPAKAGRYKVIYSLIRLPSKGAKVSPPPYNAPQESWPGEFASTAFAVNVN